MDTIGRYRLERRLGAGSFATVWLGHDDDPDVPVAVKVLAENWSDNVDVRNRFLGEARILRRIRDPRIVAVYDIGATPDGRPYFVMDFVNGGSLEDLRKAGIAPTGRPLAVFTRTDDDGFAYEAMIPVASAPDPAPTAADGLRFGTTPSGKALRFPHKGSYDDIDGTYETLTTYLDAKDIVVQDRFIEEYVTDLADKADDKLDVNIYALTR